MFEPEMATRLSPYFEFIKTNCYEYNLSYLTLWREVEDIHIAIEADSLFVWQRASHSFLMPLSKDIEKAVALLSEFCEANNIELKFKYVPGEYLDYFPSSFVKTHERENDDYLYTPDKLINLHGKHLQAKRNHISQFLKSYSYEIVPLTKECFNECLLMDSRWSALHEEYSKEIYEERMAIVNAFKYWDMLKLKGIALRIDGKIAAFTVGELIEGRNEAVIHFEKGDTSYLGIYAAINNFFIKEYFASATYIDRQEDMGLEGLRKAKLSYHPDLMAEKYAICRA